MQDIYSYITTEESSYKIIPVPIVENWEWSMYEHIKRTILYKNSQFMDGKFGDKPFKNIILAILRLQYRAEGFDVKDIVLFVNEAKNYFKSFLVKKFHEKWARENCLDTFIDEMVESYVDFGGALAKNVNQKRPEIVPLQSIAFCDQTDILAAPFAIKHNYSPDQLKDMEAQHWGDTHFGATKSIDEVLTLSRTQGKDKSDNLASGQKSKTPGKYIEVYEVHGMFPASWLVDNEKTTDAEKSKENQYVRQLQIVTFYKDEQGEKKGVTLFKGKEKTLPYKLVLRDKIFGRALGLGGAEELFQAQIWTNSSEIHMQKMLEATSKIIFKTTDTAIMSRHPNGLKDLDNLEIIELEDGKEIAQLDTVPRSLELFKQKTDEWEAHAQQLGAANDAILGESPAAGTPFKLQELITQEAHGIHEYRKGELATFLDGIYRDWIIPYISSEIVKGTTFLADLDLDELQAIADNLVECRANDFIKEKILSGKEIDPTEVDALKEKVRQEFMKGGNKRFIEIFKNEMKTAPIDVETNIAGKQKNLSQMTDKLVNIIRQIMMAPQILDDPRMAKLFNEILEYSDLSPIDFYQKPKPPQQQQIPGQPVQQAQNALQQKVPVQNQPVPAY